MVTIDTLHTKAAAVYVGVRVDSLRDLANKGIIPCRWTTTPDGAKWRAFDRADLDQYKARRLAVLESQLAAVKGSAGTRAS